LNEEEIVIEAGKTERRYWADLWRYRELFMVMAWRDVVVRYKQAVFGVAWAVLRPLLTMLVFAFVFGRVAHLPSQGVPYPLFVMAAMLPWLLFSGALSDGALSLVANANVVAKTFFPRMVLPASSVAVNLFDLVVSLPLLLGLMLWYHTAWSPSLLLLPLVLLPVLALSLGGALWLSALTVRYRDFRYVVPFLVQFGLYVSPVGYGSMAVPLRYRALFQLNPMAPVLEAVRACVLGLPLQDGWGPFLTACALGLAFLASGLWFFRRVERGFADVI
jgi:lipopolysaccharide transport system permease protein